MARAHFFLNAFTYLGTVVNIAPYADVTLYENGSTVDALPDTIYDSASGGGTKSNPFTAEANGDIEFWLDEPKYITVKLSGTGLGTVYLDYQPVMPDPADIMQSGSEYYINVMDYADGNTIKYDIDHTNAGTEATSLAAAYADGNVNVTNTNAAIALAVAAAKVSGKILFFPPGIYKGKIEFLDDVEILGSGEDKTVIMRPNGPTSGAYGATPDYNTVSMYSKSKVAIRQLTIDGNYSNNNNATRGTTADEIQTGGVPGTSDQLIENVTFRNYNFSAGTVGGTRTIYRNIKIYGILPKPTVYPADSGGSLSRDWMSFWGLKSSAYDYAKEITLENCYAQDLRIVAFTPGGIDLTLKNLTARNCHRGKSNTTVPYTVGSVSADGVGGGQISLHLTWNGVGDVNVNYGNQRPQNITVDGMHVQISEGIYTHGFEVDSVTNMAASNIVVNNVAGIGLAIANSEGLNINGLVLDTCASNGITMYNTSDSQINNPILKGTCSLGIYIYDGAGSTHDVAINNPLVSDCITPFSITATGANVRIKNPIVDAGDQTWIDDTVQYLDAQYLQRVRNASATGYGASVNGGSSTFQFAFFVGDYVGRPLFFVTAGTTNITVFNTGNTGASVRPMGGLYENSVAKCYFGLNASDNFAIIAGDGATELFSVDSASSPAGLLNGPSLAWTAFTPALYQGGASPLAVTSNCKWMRIGKLLFYRIELAVTNNANAVASQAIFISHLLPAANRPSVVGGGTHGGDGLIYRVGVQWLHVGVILTDTQSMYLMENRGNNYAGANATAFTLQNSDVISLHGFFEVA